MLLPDGLEVQVSHLAAICWVRLEIQAPHWASEADPVLPGKARSALFLFPTWSALILWLRSSLPRESLAFPAELFWHQLGGKGALL